MSTPKTVRTARRALEVAEGSGLALLLTASMAAQISRLDLAAQYAERGIVALRSPARRRARVAYLRACEEAQVTPRATRAQEVMVELEAIFGAALGEEDE